VRNNRIEKACNSKHRCASDRVFESKLGGDKRVKSFFQQYRSFSAYPVRAVMSGSTSSGRRPKCETDVMGQC
jgi:hypothetical protein